MHFPTQASHETSISRGVLRFWRDPICVGSWSLYALNRFVLAPHFGHELPFLREHLNDTLFIPAALLPFLWARHQLGLRREVGAPTWREIILVTFIASVLFEGLGPRFLRHSVGDWNDVLVYWIGALLAGWWWNLTTTCIPKQ